MSPQAICSSPVGLTRVLIKALFEFFSSAHVHSKLNLLFWEGGKKEGKKKKTEGRERSEASGLCPQAPHCLFARALRTPRSFVTVPPYLPWYLASSCRASNAPPRTDAREGPAV